ncbi:uncharacterized protein [Paramisgurnus dabryanus]|uniref:uncharacterized protein isoform X15 n=1 Tax=Paramisgurnus dabryanus TaxID=90735 RepID=UPI003CCF6FDE
MSGKAWMFTLFTTALLITGHVHYAQSECYDGDLLLHLEEELLEDHWFQIKKFSDSEEHRLLTVINTLCSTWIKNLEKINVPCNKEYSKFQVVKTFEGMLNTSFKPEYASKTLCEKYNCTDGYEIQYVNKYDFESMYKNICKKSVSDFHSSGLTCPSKSTPPSTSATTSAVFTSMPPSTSATTSTVFTSTPPSTSATTSTVSTSMPPSTSATTSTVSTRAPPSTSANSTTSTLNTSTPPSTSATTSTVFTSMPPSTSANSTNSTLSSNLSTMASAATVTPLHMHQDQTATMPITIGFLGVTLLLSLIFYLVCKQYKKQENRETTMRLSAVSSNENQETMMRLNSVISDENQETTMRLNSVISDDSVV